jgi:peroxiredoxin
MRAERAQLIVISVDSQADARRMADHAKASFPILYDKNAAVVTAYGLYDLLGDGVSAPATLVLNRDGSILGSHVGRDIADRVPASVILDALRGTEVTAHGTSS